METILDLRVGNGINRDATKFVTDACVDGQWCRFYYGRPRKIGGYRKIINFQALVRGAHVVSRNGYNNYFAGDSNNLFMVPVDNTGTASSTVDRTPAAFATSPNNIWQFSDMFDVGSSARVVFAHAGQNLAAIDSSVETPVYYGDAQDITALTSVGKSVSGGVCCIHPYVILYGNDGFILWPSAGTATNFSTGDTGSARITGSKIIKGVSIRGGAGFSPAGLFWSLEDLHRIYFVGGDTVFANENVGETYLLSSSAVVQYNGLFYWPCTDRRFSYWNGGINDLPNSANLQFFYDNLNYAYRQKVWGIAIPAFNEIWWHFPKGTSTECNHAIILNVKDNTWYDTPIKRSAGVAAKVLPNPVMFESVTDGTGNYRMWMHEFGVDQVDAQRVDAIPSYFESTPMTLVDMAPGQDTDAWTYMEWFEPDFVQTGDLRLEITGEGYPQATDTEISPPFTIAPGSGKISVKQQRRILRVKVSSNEAGGFFYGGKSLMKITEGTARQWPAT